MTTSRKDPSTPFPASIYTLVIVSVVMVGGSYLYHHVFLNYWGDRGLSLRQLATKGPNCETPSQAEQELWVREAKELLGSMKAEMQEGQVDLDEALRLFDAGKLAKDKKVRHIYVPALSKLVRKKKDFIKLEKAHRKAKTSLGEVSELVPYSCGDKIYQDCYGQPIRLLPLFAKRLDEAAKEVGVCPDISWGERDEALQAMMMVRTRKDCTDDPWKYLLGKSMKRFFSLKTHRRNARLGKQLKKCQGDLECIKPICEKAVRDTVGPPFGAGHELGAAADINNWKQLRKALRKRGIRCGYLKRDRRHCSLIGR